jgi:uncharacterized membrane protein YqjE
MPSQLEQESQPGLTTLVSGIVQDAQELIRQQLTLFQVEMKNDLHRTVTASRPLVVGGVIGLLAGIILMHGLALALPRIWPELPLWGSYAIVGGILAVAAGILIGLGIAKFKSFNPLPDQTVEGLKENLQWQTKK